ncbi:MAG: hypothetical protein ACE5J4_01355 [Candidatus Aenigmatarchaeota archaeon]
MPDKFNVKALIVLGAVFWGLYLFVAALFASANIETLWFSNEAFSMMSSVYPGVTATAAGAFIGLIWGVLCGAFCGGIFGWVYNWLSKIFK